MDQLRLEYTLLNEKLRQRDTDLEMYKTRLLDVERRQRDRPREVGRLNRENDEMRKQLESLTAISNY